MSVNMPPIESGTIHRNNHEKKRKRALYEKSDVVWKPEERDPKFGWTPISIDKYRKVEKIGEGTYGSVFKAEAPSGKLVALKMVRTENEKDGFPITAIREIKILKALDHPNIVPLMDVVTSRIDADHERKDARIYMVFEYMDHDLAGLINNPEIDFQEKHIKHYLQQILEGIYYCHEKCFVLHRDIKGSNVLINSNGEVKLADFGLARLFKNDENQRDYTNRVVTLWYRAPELLLGDKRYGPAIDMWSVGCVFAEMIFQKPTFPGESEMGQLTEIFRLCGSPDEESWPGVSQLSVKISKKYPRVIAQRYAKLKQQSPLAFDLLDKLLVLNPKKRLNAFEALEHDYFHKPPLPTPPPKLSCQPSHEFQSRKRKAEAKNRLHAMRKAKEAAPNGARPSKRPDNRDFRQGDFYDGGVGIYQDDQHPRNAHHNHSGQQNQSGSRNVDRSRRGGYDGYDGKR